MYPLVTNCCQQQQGVSAQDAAPFHNHGSAQDAAPFHNHGSCSIDSVTGVSIVGISPWYSFVFSTRCSTPTPKPKRPTDAIDEHGVVKWVTTLPPCIGTNEFVQAAPWFTLPPPACGRYLMLRSTNLFTSCGTLTITYLTLGKSLFKFLQQTLTYYDVSAYRFVRDIAEDADTGVLVCRPDIWRDAANRFPEISVE